MKREKICAADFHCLKDAGIGQKKREIKTAIDP